MGILVELFSSALGGGLLGSVASGVSKFMDNRKELKQLEMQLQHDVAMSQHEKDMAKMQLDSQTTLATIDAERSMTEADYEAMEASFEADQARYANVDTTKTSKWFMMVDVIRGIMRPAITGTLTVYLVALTFYCFTKYGVEFPSADVAAMTFAVIEGLSTTATLALSWWFGSRSHTRTRG
jgi:hypothetical protein